MDLLPRHSQRIGNISLKIKLFLSSVSKKLERLIVLIGFLQMPPRRPVVIRRKLPSDQGTADFGKAFLLLCNGGSIWAAEKLYHCCHWAHFKGKSAEPEPYRVKAEKKKITSVFATCGLRKKITSSLRMTFEICGLYVVGLAQYLQHIYFFHFYLSKGIRYSFPIIRVPYMLGGMMSYLV